MKRILLKIKDGNKFVFLSLFGVFLYLGITLFVRMPPSMVAAFILSVFMLAALNYCLFMLRIRLIKRLAHENAFALQKSELENAIMIAEEQREQEEKIYKIHHDMNNHLSVVASMLQEGDPQKAKSYIEGIRDLLN